ncbi:hypothetical protein EDD11_004491 [Mortierella claussenii]|nr:hypothetical protein EDD11_004491 [Mortierella claussenii]
MDSKHSTSSYKRVPSISTGQMGNDIIHMRSTVPASGSEDYSTSTPLAFHSSQYSCPPVQNQLQQQQYHHHQQPHGPHEHVEDDGDPTTLPLNYEHRSTTPSLSAHDLTSTPYLNNSDNSREYANHSNHPDKSLLSPSSLWTAYPYDYYITSPAKALILQTLTTLSTIVFTVLPVVIKAGADASWDHWYTWSDACRFIEPFCSGLLHTWFFYSSDLMRSPGLDADIRAAIHTAAAFFKNIITLFLEQHSQGIGLSTHPVTEGDGQLSMVLAQQLKEGYLLIQDVWEHKVSHYMYAFGALGMSWCEMVAYSGQILPKRVNLARVGHLKALERQHQHLRQGQWRTRPEGIAATATTTTAMAGAAHRQSSKWLVVLWIVAGVLYGGIVAGVTCQYPKGLYVGSVYVVVMLLVVCGYILTTPTRGLFTLGRHYILQTYVIGGVVAAVAIVIYMAVHHFDMLTSNDKSHLGSITRP